jgi:ABC-type glycerol-3-phosphate transport system substrate-binding protein
LYSQRNKLQSIPPLVLDERFYRDTFVDGSRLFIGTDGILAVPLSVDPLVMYWNKNIFANAGIPSVPRRWTDLNTLGPSLIQKNDTSNVTRAMISFGEYQNVNNAKAIISTLFFQSRNPITNKSPLNGAIVSTLDGGNFASPLRSSESIINYYTSFANPTNPLYSWNKSMPMSQDAFLAGTLALYFGFASEYGRLQDKNPNLNFDVALMPQDTDALSATYGKFTAFAITRQTRNFNDALAVIGKLTSKESVKIWSDMTFLPPVRRDLLAESQPNAYNVVFNTAAIQSVSWYDPNTKQTDIIFREMIESVTSGRKKIIDALSEANQRIEILLR